MTGSSFEERRAALWADLAGRGELAVAFSGGVDSSVLLHAAHRELGSRAVGVLADSPSLPRSELAEARRVAAEIGAELVELSTDELQDPRYRENGADRCYFCKHALFDAMRVVAAERGLAHMAFGKIQDDQFDVRPGERAASEFGILAPLFDAGFGKGDVRRYAAEAGLSVAQKPASACLASRIPHGTPVSREGLAQVEGAEDELRGLGLRVLRVRHRGATARLEVGPEEWDGAVLRRGEWEACLARHGFEAVEMAVYRSPGGAISEKQLP